MTRLLESQATRKDNTAAAASSPKGNMSFRVSLLTFLLFAAFGGLRPNLATTDSRSTTTPNAGSAIIAYWQTMLPHSTMPSAIRDLLTPNNAEANGDNPSLLPVSAFYGKETKNLNPEGTNGHNPYLLPVSAFYRKEANNLNPITTTFDGKETNDDNPSLLPVSTFYGKEVKNLNPTIFYRKGTNGDNTYLLPLSSFYGKEANNMNPAATFDRKETNGDNPSLLPVSALYGKEAKNLNPTIFYKKGTNRDNPYLLPVSSFYGKEVNNMNPTTTFKETNGDNPSLLPVSAFYGKEVKNMNPTIFYEKGTNGDNSYLLPVSAFYEKEANNLNPTAALDGKETNGDSPSLLPVSAFYGKEEKNINPTRFYGKGTNVDNSYQLPVSAFYGKEANNLNPKATIDNKEINGDNPFLLPVSAFYGKETKNLNPTIFYGKETSGDNLYLLPVSAFYGKEVKNLNPAAISDGKGTNGPVHVSITNMADAADHHHVHEHRHVDGGHAHDHFDQRNINFLFLEDALTPGSKVAPYIDPASSPGVPLLPRDVADSIPMSTKSFPDILRMFAPVSRAMADSIWQSLEFCEHRRPIKGEKRGCVTSIESMVDLAASMLGTSDLRALSSPSVPAEGRTGSKVYTVLAATAITSPGDTVTCHGIPFPYKVFLCHALVPTKVYSVTVENDAMDKEKIEEALVVCHLDTAEFDAMKMPPHVKPGDAAVCHFLNNDDVLWAPAATTLGTQGAAADVVVAAQ